MILDNLRKAGVQNTVKNERLNFDRLDPFPGEYIQAEGTYTENGATKAVRVSVGPEFGTVGPEWIKKAAMEAIKGSRLRTADRLRLRLRPARLRADAGAEEGNALRQAARSWPSA